MGNAINTGWMRQDGSRKELGFVQLCKKNGYDVIVAAKQAYENGENIGDFLRNQDWVKLSEQEIIEISYDLQAGSYIELANSGAPITAQFWGEVAEKLNAILPSNTSSILDVGTGELTTLTQVLNRIRTNYSLKTVFAIDISWSRIFKGRKYHEGYKNYDASLRVAAADFAAIPFATDSIDVVLSTHALEPNGNNFEHMLKEIFRVAAEYVCLFEPHYEIASPKAKARMDSHGYIKGVEQAIKRQGGDLVETLPFKNNWNELNPISCFVVKPPKKLSTPRSDTIGFTVPGTDIPLDEVDNFLINASGGIAFPVLKEIPILRTSKSVLCTAIK